MSAKRDSEQVGAVQAASQPHASGRHPRKVSEECAEDALFAARPGKKPSSVSVGAMRRVLLPTPVPPPPPAVASGVHAGMDDLALDLDFSQPIEQLLHAASASAQGGALVETPTEFANASSLLQPIDPMASVLSDPDLMPDDAFDFADATEVGDHAAPNAVAKADDRTEMVGLQVQRPSGSSIPSPPATGPKSNEAHRRAEQVERVRALIARGQFDDAMDLIELLRASCNDGLAEQLEREWQLAQHRQSPSPQAAPSLPVSTAEPSRPMSVVTMTRPSFEPPRVASAPPRVESHRSVPAPPPPPLNTKQPDVDPLDELGGLSAVLTVVADSAVIRTLDLDHRAGFLLSLIDGFSSVEDLLDVANMPSELTVTLLADLKRRGLVK